MSVAESKRKIDYTKNKLDERKEIVEGILNDGSFEDYFDERFKVNLTSADKLSENDYHCNALEKLADYLLNSQEVKEDKKSDEFEYKFYSDENSFRKAIEREPSIDGMSQDSEKENVIHFLKNENLNFKKSKNQKITKQDLDREDDLGQILNNYKTYLDALNEELTMIDESNLSRFKISTIMGQVKNDMILSKDMLLGVFAYKTNAEESSVVEWDLVNYSDKEHVRALLNLKTGVRADKDLQYLVEEFDDIYRKANPTKLQKDIVKLLREGRGTTDIGFELGITKQRVNKNLEMLIKRICKLGKQVK